MKRFWEQGELTFALVWIGVYVLAMGTADQLSALLGVEKNITALVAVGLTVGLRVWVRRAGLEREFGLCSGTASGRQVIWYLPLLPVVTVNLWWGASLTGSATEAVLWVVSMLCVGFLEELIFRGFLFKALSRDHMGKAVAISAVTFGLGHLVNLFSGADLLPTLLQVCYATSAGFLFTVLFWKTGTLRPCILAHGLMNSLSVFAAPQAEAAVNRIVASVFLCLLCLGYGVSVLLQTRPLPQEPETGEQEKTSGVR